MHYKVAACKDESDEGMPRCRDCSNGEASRIQNERRTGAGGHPVERKVRYQTFLDRGEG
jgi:hypothetical protein